ncbi:hypothetical protein WG922_03950 [Ramlibacter sp. AN1015]|uniref:hypothetical protein n=1 Tax=Ramlibacter sp. AN1015 TaxID=3133428 RepID=UPI0030BD408D
MIFFGTLLMAGLLALGRPDAGGMPHLRGAGAGMSFAETDDSAPLPPPEWHRLVAKLGLR